ncbi:type II secretion system protein [Phycisphaerales bacterium AB-hyl4]|uniref:Type II secretion system protein n=1 Tax=Natronomicrosphaera hydrolytica TaxID=3242702 RepID=A0ABV4U4E5_9BACT
MQSNRKGFTLIELLVVISIIALLIGILLPALGAARATARRMQSNTQIRGIHQAMVMFAQSNRSNFPGLDGDGNIAGDTGNGADTGAFRAGALRGSHPARRYAVLLNGNFFTPEYIISPADTNKVEWQGNSQVVTQPTNISAVTDVYSYAMLQIGNADGVKRPGQRVREWSETLNTEAIVMGDRAMAHSATSIYSVHTRAGSNDWRGGMASNDNSVAFETDHRQRARYGSGALDTWHMFANAVGTVDGTAADNGGWLTYSGPEQQWTD